MKHTDYIYAMVLAASLPLTAACHRHSGADTADEAPVIDVAEAVTDSVTVYKTYPGTLHATTDVDVMCRVSGTVLTQNYTGGSMVQKGQVLFTIDPSTYSNAVQQAQATLDKALSASSYAESHYEAVKNAFARNAVSQMELSQALSDRDSGRAAVADARAALRQAQLDLSYCTVRAPISGRITSSAVNPGAYVAGGGSPVVMAHIYDDSAVDAYFHIQDPTVAQLFADAQVGRLRKGAYIPLEFSDTLRHSYSGRLTYIAPDIDASTGAVEVRCSIDNPYGELRDGMYVTIQLPVADEPHAVLVRDASLSTDQLGPYVYVVNDSDRVVYTPLATGQLVDDTMRVVTRGIAPGQRYVTAAMLKVRDGMTVKPRLVPTKR